MKNNHKFHSMIETPAGTTLADILPAFAEVKHQIIIGSPNKECAGCRKPFNQTRKRRKVVRMTPAWMAVPVMFSFYICGKCSALHQKGGSARDGLLAAVQAYCEGSEAEQ